MKERLYYQDAYIREFTAEIIQRGVDEAGGHYVVLDQTAFYPTGGGQPCDLGSIQGVEVTQVEEVDQEIRHYLVQPLDESITHIKGEIDWERRFDHMQQHTGQHILSAAFIASSGIPTVSFHLGREIDTIDLDIAQLTEEEIIQAEDLANQMIMNNLSIEARFVDPSELASFPIRKAPTVEENIRLVMIPDFDYNPCGGTHPHRTGEVGMIKVLGWEKSKGIVRLSFIAGARVLSYARGQQAVLQQATRLLNCPEKDVPSQVERLLTEQKETNRLLQDLKQELMQAEAVALLQKAVVKGNIRIVSQVSQGRTMQELQRMAQQMTAQASDSVVLLLSLSDKCQLVFARGSEVEIDAASLLKQVLPLIDGKGGGKPELAQGGGSIPADPEAILLAARTYLDQQ